MTKARRAGSASAANSDPQPYDGPVERADGMRPFNRHLWPTSLWVAQRTPALSKMPFYWRIAVIELADGRFATCGFVSQIEADRTFAGEPCCFPTLAAATRAQAARIIRRVRATRGQTDHFGRVVLRDADAFALIAWALEIAQREGGREVVTIAAVHALQASALEAQAHRAERARLAALPPQPDLFASA